MVDDCARFTWYELMTTDVAAAKAFYAHVLGWDVQDASTPELAYTVFTAGATSVGGLMELPEAARKMGATPRWMGYVGVDDLDATTDRIKRLGGAVYVPPTDTNIGRIAVVADPQTVNLALLKGTKPGQQPADLDQPGRVGWHELHAADWKRAFTFYREIFGWQKANAEPSDSYRLFSAAGQTLGGMFTKRPNEPAPFWLFYFNIGDDVDAAAERVRSGGGQIMAGPLEIPGRSWVVRCTDPHGAVFALEGGRDPDHVRHEPEVGWTSEWGEFSSKGRLVGKPRSQP